MSNTHAGSASNAADPARPVGRRARNRIARHDQLMTASMEILAEEGIDGLTMMAVADRVGCAVGTIYTYFDSKSALFSALQATAIRTLLDTYHGVAERWEDGLEELDLSEDVAALARVVALGRLLVSLGDIHPREFEMLQMMLTVKQDLTTNQDRDSVLPVSMAFVNDILITFEAAVTTGALNAPTDSPYGGMKRPADSLFDRTIRWIAAFNGVLMTSNVGVDPNRIDPGLFDGRRLALSLAQDLLVAWGAQKGALAEAFGVVEQLHDEGRLLPAPAAS